MHCLAEHHEPKPLLLLIFASWFHCQTVLRDGKPFPRISHEFHITWKSTCQIYADVSSVFVIRDPPNCMAAFGSQVSYLACLIGQSSRCGWRMLCFPERFTSFGKKYQLLFKTADVCEKYVKLPWKSVENLRGNFGVLLMLPLFLPLVSFMLLVDYEHGILRLRGE